MLVGICVAREAQPLSRNTAAAYLSSSASALRQQLSLSKDHVAMNKACGGAFSSGLNRANKQTLPSSTGASGRMVPTLHHAPAASSRAAGRPRVHPASLSVSRLPVDRAAARPLSECFLPKDFPADCRPLHSSDRYPAPLTYREFPLSLSRVQFNQVEESSAGRSHIAAGRLGRKRNLFSARTAATPTAIPHTWPPSNCLHRKRCHQPFTQKSEAGGTGDLGEGASPVFTVNSQLCNTIQSQTQLPCSRRGKVGSSGLVIGVVGTSYPGSEFRKDTVRLRTRHRRLESDSDKCENLRPGQVCGRIDSDSDGVQHRHLRVGTASPYRQSQTRSSTKYTGCGQNSGNRHSPILAGSRQAGTSVASTMGDAVLRECPQSQKVPVPSSSRQRHSKVSKDSSSCICRQRVIFLDLDDTLIPTVWMRSRMLMMEDPRSQHKSSHLMRAKQLALGTAIFNGHPPISVASVKDSGGSIAGSFASTYARIRNDVDEYCGLDFEQILCDFINIVAKLSDVAVIVTNARSSNWLRVVGLMFPRFANCLTNYGIPVYKTNSEDNEEPNMTLDPMGYFDFWTQAKAREFSKVLRRILAREASTEGSHRSTCFDLVCVGDNEFEEHAFQQTVKEFPCCATARMIKCTSGLCPTLFIQQLRTMQKTLASWVSGCTSFSNESFLQSSAEDPNSSVTTPTSAGSSSPKTPATLSTPESIDEGDTTASAVESRPDLEAKNQGCGTGPPPRPRISAASQANDPPRQIAEAPSSGPGLNRGKLLFGQWTRFKSGKNTGVTQATDSGSTTSDSKMNWFSRLSGRQTHSAVAEPIRSVGAQQLKPFTSPQSTSISQYVSLEEWCPSEFYDWLRHAKAELTDIRRKRAAAKLNATIQDAVESQVPSACRYAATLVNNPMVMKINQRHNCASSEIPSPLSAPDMKRNKPEIHAKQSMALDKLRRAVSTNMSMRPSRSNTLDGAIEVSRKFHKSRTSHTDSLATAGTGADSDKEPHNYSSRWSLPAWLSRNSGRNSSLDDERQPCFSISKLKDANEQEHQQTKRECNDELIMSSAFRLLEPSGMIPIGECDCQSEEREATAKSSDGDTSFADAISRWDELTQGTQIVEVSSRDSSVRSIGEIHSSPGNSYQHAAVDHAAMVII